MDDDDYYPPERVNHAVNRLRSRPKLWLLVVVLFIFILMI